MTELPGQQKLINISELLMLALWLYLSLIDLCHLPDSEFGRSIWPCDAVDGLGV